jgi:hypothetical protein
MTHQFRYTNDEAAKKIVSHLVTQKKRSVGKLGASFGCLYRSPGGCMCAIGALIPDDQYTVELEGRPGGSLVNLIPAMSDLDSMVLGLAQQYHDNSFARKGIRYSYSKWLSGDPKHHPEKAMAAILEYTAELRRA